jgi:hypothetical protein
MRAVVIVIGAVYVLAAVAGWLAWFWMHTWPQHAWERDPGRAFWRLVWRRLTWVDLGLPMGKEILPPTISSDDLAARPTNPGENLSRDSRGGMARGRHSGLG